MKIDNTFFILSSFCNTFLLATFCQFAVFRKGLHLLFFTDKGMIDICSTFSFLKERRRLLDDGVDRSSIKIRYSQIYVSGQLAGRVRNGVFVPPYSLGDPAPQLIDLLASNNVANSNFAVNSNNAVNASPSSGTVSASN